MKRWITVVLEDDDSKEYLIKQKCRDIIPYLYATTDMDHDIRLIAALRAIAESDFNLNVWQRAMDGLALALEYYGTPLGVPSSPLEWEITHHREHTVELIKELSSLLVTLRPLFNLTYVFSVDSEDK